MFPYLGCKHELVWLGFCQSVLSAEATELPIVDYLRYSWKCNMKFSNGKDLPCIIYGQWKQICKARKFTKGSMVKFGVTDANNRIIFILPPLMLVLRSRIPLISISGRISGYGLSPNLESCSYISFCSMLS